MTRAISILGASGFLGNHLIYQLNNNKFFLRILSRNNYVSKIINNAEYYVFNEHNIKSINSEFFESEILINCMGDYNIKDSNKANYEIPLEIFKKSLKTGIKKWINISSAGVYKKNNEIINENSLIKCENNYELSKYKLDLELIQLSKKNNINLKIIRPTNIIGKKMNTSSLLNLINAVNYNFFFYIESKNHIANFVNVRDVINLIIYLINKDSKNMIYNISQDYTYEEIVKYIKNYLNKNNNTYTLPKLLAYFISIIFFNKYLSKSRILALTNKNQYSINRIAKDLKFNFDFGVKKAIKEIIDEKYSIYNH